MTVSLMTQGSTILNATVLSANASVLSADAGVLSAEGEEAAAADSTAGSAGVGSLLGGSLLIPMLLFVVLIYFLAIRPQKKQEKQAEQMRSSLQVGDEVVTVGGIVGIIVRISDDTLLLESGGDRNKIRVKTIAVSENLTAHEEIEKAKVEKAKAEPAKKGKPKKEKPEE